jgi:hypothetical protein
MKTQTPQHFSTPANDGFVAKRAIAIGSVYGLLFVAWLALQLHF